MSDVPIPAQYNNSTTPGYSFAGNGVNGTIAAAVLVGSAEGVGVLDSNLFDTDSLINNGNVAGRDAGVDWRGDNGHITNGSSAQIVGITFGVVVRGDHEVVVNHGRIWGLNLIGVGLDTASNHTTVTNDGEIYGLSAGVFADSGFEGGTINNVSGGLIRSDHDGIGVFTNTGLKTIITNAAGATVHGGGLSVHTRGAGRIQLTNDGKLIGGIRCDAPNENDVVINHGTISGSVILGSGNDTYNGIGGGTVTGSILGGDGADSFFAGKAREVFNGGAGNDKFVFNSILFSPASASRDVIQAFKHSEADRIDVHLIDADLTHAGNQAFHFIGTDTFAHYHSTHAGVVGMLRFDPGSDHLQGNVNGVFTTAELEVALPGVAAMFASDFVL